MAKPETVTVEQGDSVTLHGSESWERTIELPAKSRGRTARLSLSWRRDSAELVVTAEED